MENEASGHIVPTFRKQREMKAGIQVVSLVPFLFSLKPQALGMELPTFRVGLSSSATVL